MPGNWEVVALGDVCSVVTSGSRGWADYYSKSGAGFIRAQNIRFGTLKLDDMALVNPPSKSEGSRTQVSKGDLLIRVLLSPSFNATLTAVTVPSTGA